MNLQALDIAILGPALAAGLLVVSTHVPLGQQVLARGIIFIDLAVAQIAGLGLIAAYSFGWEPGGWQMQIIAFCAALIGSIFLSVIERYWPDIQEPLIGCIFVLAATGGILLLSTNPQGGEHLKELLNGQILWVTYEQLLPVAALYALVLALWFGWPKSRNSLWFYILFALCVTTSVQLIGVYLVFASLIIPALAARKSKRSLLLGYGIGGLGYLCGLGLSATYDLPSGAIIVWLLAIIGITVAALIKLTIEPEK